MILNCPLGPSLTAIPQPSCAFKLDQIVRLAFQRRQPDSSPPFASLADIQTLSKWTTLMNASDSTKIIISPLFAGMVIPSSEAQTTGGNDNSTINGVPDYNGEGSVTVTGQFKNLPPITKRALDLLSQESLSSATGNSNLTVDFFNRDGYVFAENPYVSGNPSTKYRGVPIFNFRVSSLGSEGFNAPNIHTFSFSMNATWADYLVSIKPNFDPLIDLGAAPVIPTTFNAVIQFDTTATPAAIAGVTVTTQGGAINANQKFEFNSISPAPGLPMSMVIKVSGTTEALVDFPADYSGQTFRYTPKAGGTTFIGAFTDGTVNF